MAAARPKRVSSLTLRVLAVSTLWAVIALIAVGLIINTLYRQGTERGFRELLRAHLYNVVNSVWINGEGELRGEPEFGDLRYSQPATGWYWVVEPIEGSNSPPKSSISLGGRSLDRPSQEEISFNALYERAYDVVDPFGNDVVVMETEVELNDEGRVARFRVTGNRDAVEADVAEFTNQLTIALVIFGVASLFVNAGAILIGLRPLDSVRRALESIRTGKSSSLNDEFPREIAPLAGEVNALIDTNRRVVERARMQVGNLAHSLKTPLAVLLNESKGMTSEHGDLVRNQAETMQRQVQTYLDRARIVAQSGSILARTEAEPAFERLIRVMRRLNPKLAFELSVKPKGVWIALEQHDLEEIGGNLLDNAAKFARSRIKVSLAVGAVAPARPDDGPSDGWLTLVVEDDGPGLTADQMAEAVKRGRRLDESKPGTGLGLSIVDEIAREYHGVLRLTQSPLGGLRAEVTLPAIKEAAPRLRLRS